MHPEILSKEQVELLPVLQQFYKDFYLVGGTAIALQIGHRHSIDFDLFTNKLSVGQAWQRFTKKQRAKIIFEDGDQIHFLANKVKVTFYEYPFTIKANIDFDGKLRMPDLLTLAAMKAYALGRRSKWKDYVDMYFLLRDHLVFADVINKAQAIFGDMFSDKVFLSQLSYFNDISYEEMPVYTSKIGINDTEIKRFLTQKALEAGTEA
ncbi:nucleotidyl transferase AbiEii/AbiGii toxin family protein [Microgenomates group bacterium]|nr:nucleotidyl transferase AbiEii/AbiGii toxin family protein [Microgenomates group bacterium]